MEAGVGNRLPFAKKTRSFRAQSEGSKLRKAVAIQPPLCPGARAAPTSGMSPPAGFEEHTAWAERAHGCLWKQEGMLEEACQAWS